MNTTQTPVNRLSLRWPGVRRVLLYVLVPCAALAGGCPEAGGNFTPDYDEGFAQGLAAVEYLSMGFEDSWLTNGARSMYRGSEIEFLEDETFEAGFNDGIWNLYNDGYFNAYEKSTVLGFNAGYDEGFQADFAEALAAHKHQEFAHGGYVDGFNDGFSEGFVFGAEDFSLGLPASLDNWRFAYADWFKGIDVFVEEADIGTGERGPVVLYEWGEDPADLGIRTAKASQSGRERRHARTHSTLGKARLTLSDAS